MPEWISSALVALLLAAAGQFYLAPASNSLWAHDRSRLMSNGGDATTLPFIYDVILRAAEQSPRNLFYGSIHNPQLGPPYGSGMWVPWIERWLVVFLGTALPVEVLPTAVVWVLMILAGMCFYAFARVEHWPRWLAAALAFAYAFNAYTRARAVVHDALVAIYCLPLIFVALRLLKRSQKAKSVAVAALLLFLSTWTAHYYLLMLIASTPLFLWFQLRVDEHDEAAEPLVSLRRLLSTRLGVLTLAAAPALAFLAWNYLHPLAPDAPRTRPASPDVELAPLYMKLYAARPIDYLSGDVALGRLDLNPLRGRVNDALFAAEFDGSNVWERANGIRWCVLLPFCMLVAGMCLSFTRTRLLQGLGATTRKKILYWLCFAGMMFWCSLSPDSIVVYGNNLGASTWVHALFPEFRVPSRFGPFFHFSVLATVGTYLSARWQGMFGRDAPKWRRAIPCLFPLLMVLDYPPVLAVPMDRIAAPRTELLAAGGGQCGIGMRLPYARGAGSRNEVETYRAFQQLRHTNCQDLQQPLHTTLHSQLVTTFGDARFEEALTSRELERLQQRFVGFVRCMQLDWVIFRPGVPESFRSQVCGQLQWQQVAPDACSAPLPRQAHWIDLSVMCSRALD